MGAESVQRMVRRADMYSRVTSLAPQDLRTRWHQIVGGNIHGEEVFSTLSTLDAEMSRSVINAKRRRIQGIALDIPKWDDEFLGRGITLRNRETNASEQVGHIMPILRDGKIVDGQRLFVLNSGLVFVGAGTPSQGPKDKTQFLHSAEPYILTPLVEDVYEVGNVIKDRTANDIVKLVEARGMEITLMSTRDADLDPLGEVVDATMQWVADGGEDRRRMVSREFDPVVTYVENILEDAGQISDAYRRMSGQENL